MVEVSPILRCGSNTLLYSSLLDLQGRFLGGVRILPALRSLISLVAATGGTDL